MEHTGGWDHLVRGGTMIRMAATVTFLFLWAACSTQKLGDSATARGQVLEAPALPDRFGVGRAATAEEIAKINLDVNPSGEGLPEGRGTAAEGAVVFAAKCAACHGPKGEGTAPPNPALVGRSHEDFLFANDLKAVKTVGNYWPYATTLYDYITRAMPQNAIGTLTPNETYAVIAWILSENKIIAPTDVVDATSLPKIKMPGRDKFVRDDRTGGPTLK